MMEPKEMMAAVITSLNNKMILIWNRVSSACINFSKWLTKRDVFLLIGLVLCLASLVTPWFYMPLDGVKLSIFVPFQPDLVPHIPGLSYGLVLMILFILVTYLWLASKNVFKSKWVFFSGISLLILTFMLYYQFVFANFQWTHSIAWNGSELRSITKLYGYRVANTSIQSTSFSLSAGTQDLRTRLFQFLIQPGYYLAMLAGVILVGRSLFIQLRSKEQWKFSYLLPAIIALAICALTCVRPWVAQQIYSTAQDQLTQGQYGDALASFNSAHLWNSSLEYLPDFHIDKGQALYALGDSNNGDTAMYQAYNYSQQKEYTLAVGIESQVPDSQRFQLLNEDIISNTLNQVLAGNIIGKLPANASTLPYQPIKSTPTKVLPNSQFSYYKLKLQNSEKDPISILADLANNNPKDVLIQYTYARVLFSDQEYTPATAIFHAIAAQTKDKDIASSADTYLGMCLLSEGDYNRSRAALQQAVKLDPYYDNQVARALLVGFR